MAPFKLIFASVLVLVSAHIMVLECSRAACADSHCARRNACPSSCSCLGSLVDCGRRGLVDVPSDLPYWGKILDLQRNNIGSIEDSSFSGLSNLTELDLSNNQLRIVNSTTFQNLGSLQKLILNHNHLVELPQLENNSHLALISLQHNEIHSLNSSILEGLPKLQILDLSFNNLVDLPVNTFGNSSSLLHLTLSHNRLVSLEKGLFDNLTSLESLKLSKNHLPSVPRELFRQLATLQHLEMNSNSLTSIEGLSFQGLSSLVVLKMRHSAISSLQDGAFYGLNGIKKLQLDFNNVGKVTKGWLYGLNSLQRLYINNNNISEIEDDAWDSGRRLLELDMSHNQLQTISSKSFDKLYALKRLILSDNRITYIEEDAFRSLSVLQYLELKNNEVSWTIEDTGKVFAGLSRLKFLGLANNGIRSLVRRAFQGLPRLEVLNLTHNDLTTLEEDAFGDLGHLRQLDLNSSSLLCDCRLAWVAGGDFPHQVHAHCGFPEKLRGASIFEVAPAEMLCESSPKPMIVKEPPTKITLKGENVTLECQARSSGSSPMTFHWRKEGRLLHSPRHPARSLSNHQGDHTLSTSVLNIRDIRDEDEGRYQCVVSNAFGSVYSGRARITVHVYPVFTKTPADMATRAGNTARLECGARGQPRPDISWQKDGGAEDFPAARERRMHVMPTDDVFFIVSVKPGDTGTYSCTARNVAGTIVANATLTVLETPSFVKPMEEKETRAGETTVLECLAAGSPKPRLRWSRDGGPLHPTERHFFTAGDQLLIIVQTQAQDAGEYACEMTNALGTERGTSRLRVIQATPGVFSEDGHAAVTTGVVVIAVVICIVGTSIIWVVIIYHTRKRGEGGEEELQPTPPPTLPPSASDLLPSCRSTSRRPQSRGNNTFLDSNSVSGHSKDSSCGTGDSGRQSGDELLDEDHGCPLLLGPPSRFGVPVVCSPDAPPPRVSTSSFCASRELVPLLQTFGDGRALGMGRWPQRSFSAEQLDPCQEARPFLRTESDATERDSGFSTLPRSVTLASVSNWSNRDSPRFRRLPKDVPNDSGSFSMGGDEGQEPLNGCRFSTLPVATTPGCSCVTTSSAKT